MLRAVSGVSFSVDPGDGAVVDRAVKLVAALSPIDGCADLAALREPTAPPRDPSLRDSVEQIRDLVAQAKASFSSARSTRWSITIGRRSCANDSTRSAPSHLLMACAAAVID